MPVPAGTSPTLGDSYATVDELATYLSIEDDADNVRLGDALATASRQVEKWCGRQFNDAGVASTRTYAVDDPHVVEVDDFDTGTGLVVATDEDGDGVYETTWPAGDYELQPLNGVVDGEPGWPFWMIAATGRRFPSRARCGRLQVTARWGWAAVPAPVKAATLILAAEGYKLSDAPFGVAGFGDFGVVRIRDNPMAANRLAPYRRDVLLVA
jgi:hypothetical protein